MLKLLLIRHAESRSNHDRRLPGRSPDDLTPIGISQAQRLGQWSCAQGWFPSHIYYSPLGRSRQTLQHCLPVMLAAEQAEAAVGHLADAARSAQMPLPLTVNWAGASSSSTLLLQPWPDLQEIDQGILSGLTWAEAEQQQPALCQQLLSTWDWLPIPEGEGLQDRSDRARRVVQHVLTHHGNGDRVWLLSHSGILAHILSHLLGCDRAWGLAIANTGRFELWLDRDRWDRQDTSLWNTALWQIHQFNRIDLDGNISTGL